MIPVLLVEDEFLVRLGLKTCVPWEELGYRVVAEADSAETAVPAYEAHRPRLVITDIRLPCKSGLELMQELRALDPSLRFIIISALDDFSIAQQAIEIGVEGYFVKGDWDTEKLAHLLGELRRTVLQDAAAEARPQQPASMAELCRAWQTLRRAEPLQALRARQQPLYLALLPTPGASIRAFAEMVDSCLRLPHYLLCEPARLWLFVAADRPRLEGAFSQLLQTAARYLNAPLHIGVSGNYFPREDLERTVFEALLSAGHAAAEPVEYYQDHPTAPVKHTLRRFEDLLQTRQYQAAATQLAALRRSLLQSYSVQGFLGTVYGLTGLLTLCGVDPAVLRRIWDTLDLDAMFSQLEAQILQLQQRPAAAQSSVHVKKAKDYIHAHLHQPIQVSAVAQAIHVSPNYLGKVFQSETGTYLTDYINRVKMERAKELLSERRYNVAEVAAQVGIPDQRYFSKLFKRHCGTTPRDYLQSLQD